MNGKILTCVIVDDEPLAREGLLEYVTRTDGLKCVALCRDTVELARFLEAGHADIVFMDIRMPGLSGLEFLETAPLSAAIVIVTAYPQYAIKGFDLDVADYLVKPVSYSRFARAVAKAAALTDNRTPALLVRADRILHRLQQSSVIMAEAMENYVRLHTAGEVLTVRATFKAILAQLDSGVFVRIHKSYAVNIRHVISLSTDRVTLTSGLYCPVSRNGYRDLTNRLCQSQSLNPSDDNMNSR